ncbi:lycopene cyclase family protein [Kaistella polysaccharea]|uniref:lycopene cyclase family protein n=1 Tax=Kaistella polysaccharea TaxID=2878534 RepID=UPI001CF58402|nr:lycopene cyclase family protein [Kaistella polysaccharea]
MNNTNSKYDYIIAGSGCAGLSLLYRLLIDPVLQSKKILVIDRVQKNANDRTWCFWEEGKGLFESVVTHEWKSLIFKNEDFTRQFDLEKYRYKMIQGKDFYDFVLSYASNFENVTFKNENIKGITSDALAATVETEDNRYQADYLFNSTSLFNPKITEENSLLQHFTGWVIKTTADTFDAKVGTLMDFTLDQKHGATFMYVLPTSPTEALVEYTLFSKSVLPKEEYQTALKHYIKNDLQISDYEITHTEFGIIPMSLAKFERKSDAFNRIINIGTAGGYTKASSGYTFQFVQKNTAQIIENLVQQKNPNPEKSFDDKRYEWYDRTLLEVILSGKMQGKEIFSTMFSKRSPEDILKFLGNESTVWDDLKIVTALPIGPFMIAGLNQL